MERECILAALERNEDTQTRTAEQRNIGAVTLYWKLERYGRIPARRAPRSRS